MIIKSELNIRNEFKEIHYLRGKAPERLDVLELNGAKTFFQANDITLQSYWKLNQTRVEDLMHVLKKCVTIINCPLILFSVPFSST
jgi:hypothetical protein